MRICLFVVLFLFVACAKAPVSLSPTGARTFQANQAVVALGTLQHAAIELNKIQVCPTAPATTPACHPLLSDTNTGVVVDNATTAFTAVRSVPEGWKATIQGALTAIAVRLDATGKTQLASYLTAATSVLAALAP